MKQMKHVFCSLLTGLLVLLAVPSVVNAAVKAPVCPKQQTVEYYTSYMNNSETPASGSGYIFIKNLSASATITDVKSSNSHYTAQRVEGINAILVELKSGRGQNGFYTTKDGETTKLSFTVKQNNKSYKLSCKVTFKKHSKVFTKVKIGSRDYTKVSAGHWMVMSKQAAPTSNVKIDIKTAKNYKVDNIEIFYRDGSYKTVKNGAKVSLKNASTVTVNYHTTAKPKYYKKPTSSYRGYFFGGSVKTPLHEYFEIVYTR